MSNSEGEPRGGILSRLPLSVTLAGPLIIIIYSLAVLTDTIEDPIPNDIKGILYIVVAIGLFVHAVRLHRES
jgi:hypothetical protein